MKTNSKPNVKYVAMGFLKKKIVTQINIYFISISSPLPSNDFWCFLITILLFGNPLPVVSVLILLLCSSLTPFWLFQDCEEFSTMNDVCNGLKLRPHGRQLMADSWWQTVGVAASTLVWAMWTNSWCCSIMTSVMVLWFYLLVLCMQKSSHQMVVWEDWSEFKLLSAIKRFQFIE